MMADLREATLRRAGLELRIPKCTWTSVQRPEQEFAVLRVWHETHPNQQAMRCLPRDEYFQVFVRSFPKAISGEPRGFQRRRWRRCTCVCTECTCGAGREDGLEPSMQVLRTLQLCVTRRACGCWPAREETQAEYMKRTVREYEQLWKTARAPTLFQSRVAGMATVWKGASWFKVVKAVLFSEAEPSRGRLDCGHRPLSKQRLDEAIQRAFGACLGEELSWHEVAEDRDMWRTMGTEFVRRVLRRPVRLVEQLPPGRRVMHRSQPET